MPIEPRSIGSEEAQTILVDSLYFHPDNTVLPRAMTVAWELQEWLDDNSAGAITAGVAVTVTAGGLLLEIGLEDVWDSEVNDWTELSAESCQQRYKQRLDDLSTVFAEKLE